MDEYNNKYIMCVLVMIENVNDNNFLVEKLVRFFDGYKLMDKVYNWGLKWVVGRKQGLFMGLGFRKSVNIILGVKFNLSRSGYLILLNLKGMKYNISSRGIRIIYLIFGIVIKKIF